jgi:membrane protease YdiL (CAAX protease family)
MGNPRLSDDGGACFWYTEGEMNETVRGPEPIGKATGLPGRSSSLTGETEAVGKAAEHEPGEGGRMMKPLTGWIRQHEVTAFFALTYALSWGLWLPWIVTRIELLELLGFVGLFAPALACIVVARVVEPGTAGDHREARRMAFLATWILVATIFILNARAGSGKPSPVVAVVFAVIALIPAFIIASGFSANPGVRARLASLVRPRGHPVWYLLALLLVPALRLLSVPVSQFLGWETLSEPARTGGILGLAGSVVISFFYIVIAAGGLNEETGWTGFALPRLLGQHSPLIASAILWFFWILWHMPLHFAGVWNPDTDSLVRALVGTFFARFIFTWLYNRSEGGIWTAILFHASANAAFEFLPVTRVQFVLEAVMAIAVVVGDRMWQKLPADHPAVSGGRGGATDEPREAAATAV